MPFDPQAPYGKGTPAADTGKGMLISEVAIFLLLSDKSVGKEPSMGDLTCDRLPYPVFE